MLNAWYSCNMKGDDMRILIAEDDFIGRKLLQKFLTQFGRCDIAVNGMEAVNAFLMAHKEGKPYEMICLDILMPIMDGLKVLRTIRDIERQKGILGMERSKVIITTALNDRKTVSESYDSGCEAYAWKPIDLEKFREAMVKLGLIEF